MEKNKKRWDGCTLLSYLRRNYYWVIPHNDLYILYTTVISGILNVD
jgi:hypothetical protein